jgi:hypothetical protein
MDFIGNFGSLIALIGHSVSATTQGFTAFLERTAWLTGWMQALFAGISVPLTFAVAAWSSRKAAHDALTRDWLTRAQAHVAERERQEEQAAHELFERHCNLATQILYCDIRIKWSGGQLEEIKSEESISEGVEVIFHLIDIVDYYSNSIKQINLHNSRVHHEIQAITGPIDDVLILLMGFRRGLSSLLNDVLGGDSEDVKRLELLQKIGDWSVNLAGEINKSLLKLLDLMGPDVAVWVKRKRPTLEEAFSQEELQSIPHLLLTSLAHRGASPTPA